MQARVAREGEIYVIRLSGRLDVETAEPFRDACLNHLRGRKVVFDFRGLSFVGSSGILPFLETMQEFAAANANGFKFSGVGSEFKKVFAATPLHVIEIYENENQAIDAFMRPPMPAEKPAAVQPVPLQAAPVEASPPQSPPEDEAEEATQVTYGFLTLKPLPEEGETSAAPGDEAEE